MEQVRVCMLEQPHCLMGKTILSVSLAKDREAIKFVLSDGEVTAIVDAECCSSTWIESVELPALGFPAVVTAVEELELDQEAELKKDPEGYEDDDAYISFYGYKITTNRGEIVLDYRNESNGYYGGSLVWPENGHYDAEHVLGYDKKEWEELKP